MQKRRRILPPLYGAHPKLESRSYIKRGYFFIKRGYRVHQKRILLQGFSKRLFQESLKREPRTYARAASLRASGTVLRPCCCVRRPQLPVAMQEGYGFGFSAPTLDERGSSRFHRPTVQEVKSLRTMAVSRIRPRGATLVIHTNTKLSISSHRQCLL